MIRVIPAVVAVVVLGSACGIFGSDDIEVKFVELSEDALQLTIAFFPCIVEDSVEVGVDETSERVEVRIGGPDAGADCTGGAVVTLNEPLGDRVLIVGSPAQRFKDCARQYLCEQ